MNWSLPCTILGIDYDIRGPRFSDPDIGPKNLAKFKCENWRLFVSKGCSDCTSGTDDSQGRLPEESFDRFALCYFVAVAILLAPAALASYAQSVVPYDASWESIDYVRERVGWLSPKTHKFLWVSQRGSSGVFPFC